MVVKNMGKKEKIILPGFKEEDKNSFEIGIDESGRGPLFGRVYCAGVVLPRDSEFDFSLLKDSKKFCSKKKLHEVAEYIKEHSLYYSIQYRNEKEIDRINIRNANIDAMNDVIFTIYQNIMNDNKNKDIKIKCYIDGNDFKIKPIFNEEEGMIETIPYELIKGGDNLLGSIAAASILAKDARDTYIHDLCDLHPELDERYKIRSNVGYGAKVHIEGIKQYGITEWHRRSYGICKSFESISK